MASRIPDDEDDIPFVAKYSVLRKNFVKDLFLSTVFIVSFAMVFMLAWDVWVDTINLNTQAFQLFRCALIAIIAGIVITVPLNFLLNALLSRIRERQWKKQLEKEE